MPPPARAQHVPRRGRIGRARHVSEGKRPRVVAQAVAEVDVRCRNGRRRGLKITRFLVPAVMPALTARAIACGIGGLTPGAARPRLQRAGIHRRLQLGLRHEEPSQIDDNAQKANQHGQGDSDKDQNSTLLCDALLRPFS